MESELLVKEIFGEGMLKCEVITLPLPRIERRKAKYVHDKYQRTQRKPVKITEQETDLCIALWRGVVMQSIYDISAGAKDYEKKLLKAETYSWFSSEDFHLVCELAEMNPNKVLDLVKLVRCGRVQVLDSKTFKISKR